MSKSLVRRTQSAVAKSDGSTTQAAGMALAVGGGSALAVSAVAMLLPGGVFLWAIVMLVMGGFLATKG
jgi:hypothetical protein